MILMHRLYLLVIYFFLIGPSKAQHSLISNFSEVSASYIGSCYAIDYLQKNKCTNTKGISVTECEEKIMQVTPEKIKKDFKYMLSNIKIELNNNAIDGVNLGFEKILKMENNNIELACKIYNGQLMTFSYSQFEELKRMSKVLK